MSLGGFSKGSLTGQKLLLFTVVVQNVTKKFVVRFDVGEKVV